MSTDPVEIPPMDEHNTKLVDNVHPPDWTNPTPEGRYNLVVIGAGTAGLVTAAGAAGLGAKVALVERHLMGGDCLNVGCVPSKGIIAAARAAHAAKAGGKEFGIEVDPDAVKINFSDAMERMRKLRAEISKVDSAKRFSDLGIDVFIGQASFVDSQTVAVGDQRLTFKKAVICSGARADAPPIPGLDEVDYLTNENLFNLTELPKRLGIIGAGPIGCEMAQAFARMGSKVLLIEATHGILPREDSDASAIVRESLAADGVQLLCCGKDLKISKIESAQGARLTVESHGKSYDEEVDHLLVSVGRTPNIEGLELEKVGVEFEKQGVKVNDQLQTTNPNIYAAGDICMQWKFTHAADFAARIVIQNALFSIGGLGKKKLSSLTMPWCTYTEPEIAHVGLYEKEAEEEGIETDTYIQSMDEVDRAILEGRTAGFVKILVKKGSDRILGATIVAENAGDMISEITTAMNAKMGLGSMASVIHPYPTTADAIRKVGDQYNKTRLTDRVKNLFKWWLKRQR
jgi:pyruvate/2-oxoglutarate dehydrogenase complex dihydrolipoamide dehydrogenase (E3) component